MAAWVVTTQVFRPFPWSPYAFIPAYRDSAESAYSPLRWTYQTTLGPHRMRISPVRAQLRPFPVIPGHGERPWGPTQNKRRCRRSHAARLRRHHRPGHDGTSTYETRCGSGGRASGASRAAPAVCGVFEPSASQNFVSSAFTA